MNSPTHTIDPDGEVIIILRDANSPFAPGSSTLCSNSVIIPSTLSNIQSPHVGPEVSKISLNPPELDITKQSKKDKKKKKGKKIKAVTTMTSLTISSTIEEPFSKETAAEGYPAEEPTAEETIAEEDPAEEPAAEEIVAEENPVEEPAAEETVAAEDSAELPVHSCVRVRVSAKHLMLASPVLKKQLTGSWKESITYHQEGSVEVIAEKWDLEAFMILLRAIHGQNYRIPLKLTLEMLAKVAVIADYYDCRETFFFLINTWIKNLDQQMPTVNSRDLTLWLWIAWFFRLPAEFKLSTSIAMSQSNGRIMDLGLPIPGSVMGKSRYILENSLKTHGSTDFMNESREKAIEKLIASLHEICNAFLNGIRGCNFECRSIMYGALDLQMRSSNLRSATPEGSNYNSIVKTIVGFKSPIWCASSSVYSGYRNFGSNSTHHCSHSSFASAFGKLEDSLEGLELDWFTTSQ
ncbi:uncharacterized protein N7500_008978 [Penicillium coprophilum]|uniref:uncharacterized protein n=1 Tax=Penicillium coprophilum TaxID=36646 RepID=UPI00238C5FF8|nr:uncharacterized protein N7500_008978 [Penicillium coprophilum]KAJ5159327.1 hypothetical protein N7500_008978 [Penicillium coprophilum]